MTDATPDASLRQVIAQLVQLSLHYDECCKMARVTMDTAHTSYPRYPHTQEMFAARYAVDAKHTYDAIEVLLLGLRSRHEEEQTAGAVRLSTPTERDK